MYTAGDVMQTKVITISPDSTVQEAIGILLKNHISGAPVIDGRGSLVGVISEFQLLETVFDPRLCNENVQAFMTKDVISVSERALLAEVATLFITHRIRRLPVVRGGQVVGLVTRSDLLRYVTESGEEITGFLHAVRKYAESRSKLNQLCGAN